MFRLSLNRFCQSFSDLKLCTHFEVKTVLINYESIRGYNSFFTRVKAEQLWKGALGVSKMSAKRGRKGGGGKILKQDLNRGQRLGSGRIKMVWPGLNAPVVTGRQTLSIKYLGRDEHFDENILKARSRMRRFSGQKVHPLDRGWSGTKMGGRWIGPPDPVNGEHFVGFDTAVLDLRPIFHMTALFGKFKRYKCLTVTGNMNGLAGFAVDRHIDGRVAPIRSKNRAAQRLQYINLFEGNTLYHNFYSKFWATELFVRKLPKGSGVKGHRAVVAICEAVGLTDIECQVEGSRRNYLNITRAFFNGLMKQKTYQQMADEKRLNVVELVGKYKYPVVLGRPSNGCRTEQEISPDEILDYNMFIYNGRVIHPPQEKPMFYTKENSKYSRSWNIYMKKWQYRQFREQSRIDLISKYGSLESYITLKDRQRLSAKKSQIFEEMSSQDLNENKTQNEVEK